jgi:uncharacterized protein YbaR (Trm112 family)
MFIELVDALRCPNPHEESWLVAAADRMEARHIVEGTLGCPVCHASYPVHRGVVDFRRGEHAEPVRAQPADAEQAMRLAAFLGLSDALGFAVLAGEWASHAPLLRTLVETPLVLVDPPAEVEGEPGVSVIRCDGELPLAAGAARGIAVDTGSAARVASAVRATRVKGRLVAPAAVPLPAGVRELARDDAVWVGERETLDSPMVTLHVRRGRAGG